MRARGTCCGTATGRCRKRRRSSEAPRARSAETREPPRSAGPRRSGGSTSQRPRGAVGGVKGALGGKAWATGRVRAYATAAVPIRLRPLTGSTKRDEWRLRANVGMATASTDAPRATAAAISTSPNRRPRERFRAGTSCIASFLSPRAIRARTMGARVAVTGAAGFIGSHLVRGFDARGASVLPLVRTVEEQSSADARALEDALVDASILRGVDVVVHSAAVRHRYGVGEAGYRTSNVDLVERAMTRVRRRRRPAVRLRQLGRRLRLSGALAGERGEPVRPAHALLGDQGRGGDARPADRARSRDRPRHRAADDRLRRRRSKRHARQDGDDDPRRGLSDRRSGRERSPPHARRRHRRRAMARVDARRGRGRRLHSRGAGDDDAARRCRCWSRGPWVATSRPGAFRRRSPVRSRRSSMSPRTAGSPSCAREPPVNHEKLDVMTLPIAFDIAKARRVLGYAPAVGYEEGVMRTLRGSWPAMARAGTTS